MLWTTFVLAVRQLARNKTRTGLTALGVMIGVAAVIAMVGIGRGATRAVNEDLESIGQNLLFVVPGNARGPGGRGGVAKPFTDQDLAAIREQIADVDAAVPVATMSTVAAWGEETLRTSVTGSSAEYLRAMRWEVARGRDFDEAEHTAGSEVCLLGDTVATELFGGADPLDATLRADQFTCRVVGVLAPKGQSSFGQDQDDFLLIPIRTFQRRIQGDRDIATIFVSATEDADSQVVKERLEALLTERRHIREGAEPDFSVRDMAEVVAMLDGVSRVLTGFLAAIAAVSLLVGGIGIMNIMMVSVTERTREIGIRLAVGALARDVLLQFLVEAMVLSGLGGLAGIALGLLISWGASAALDIPLVVDPLIIALAFGVSAAIGVVFGFFPARRAANLRPIDALRHE
ncbi:MAG: FtsX-like permease family protein [Deltaproteobacteria bacterium]|nr:MAG: FtsX-like permease family protein [Deltaproteobacteria bacterium]